MLSDSLMCILTCTSRIPSNIMIIKDQELITNLIVQVTKDFKEVQKNRLCI